MHPISSFVRAALPVPRYLMLPTLGIDISSSTVKGVLLEESPKGTFVRHAVERRLPAGTVVDGDVAHPEVLASILSEFRAESGVSFASLSLPETKSYLFETSVPVGFSMDEAQVQVEQSLESFVPLPPSETVCAIDKLSRLGRDGKRRIAGVAYAHRIVDSFVAIGEEAGFTIRGIESELHASARALTPCGDTGTYLTIDFGRTTTKLAVIEAGLPLFGTTLDIGGHALTLAVQKHFGVTEEEAKKVKLEHGIAVGVSEKDSEFATSIMPTLSALRDELKSRIHYWKNHELSQNEPIEKALLVGGNSSLKGLPEYLTAALEIPVVRGNVFANLASPEVVMPPFEFEQSLGYATAIGLALRTTAPFV